MYLAIQNTGVAPVEAFTVLGVSTARGDSSKIGQFGSGSKLGINVLLRAGLNPVIFLGSKKLEFFSKPAFMGEKQYNHVCYNYDGKIEKTGFSLEFGEMDWDATEMALRELISNAIDAVGVANVVLDVVAEPKSAEGMTGIFILLTPDVQKYYAKLSSKFLHFVGKNEISILDKQGENNQAQIYRKGVFVRSLSVEKSVSMFNYNFGDSVKIDETRNMDDYTCQSEAARLFGENTDCLKKYFEGITSTTKVWEDDFSFYHINYTKSNSAWESVYPNTYFTDSAMIADIVRKQGKKVVMVRNYSTLRNSVRAWDAAASITIVEKNGNTVVEATNTTMINAGKVWRKLIKLGLTNGKEMCSVKSFKAVVTETGGLRGYYENDCIYINVDDEGSFQTILEEFAHYITGKGDGERIFQEFAFNVATRAMFD